MHFGIDLPTAGEFANVQMLAILAREAEEAGWDGFFLYDQIAAESPQPLVDLWIALTAIALQTKRIRFGPLVVPLARRRPWKVARETVTLDHLSGGRFILGVGLGDSKIEFEHLGEEGDRKVRAAMLDESLDILTGLWRGQPFQHSGAHYHIDEAQFLPTPLQSPRIPVWVGGIWPNRAPFRRAARWDGAFPHYRGPNGVAMMPVLELQRMVAYLRSHRSDPAPFEVIVRNKLPMAEPSQEAERVASYAEAGLTWWLEGIEGRNSLAAVRACIRRGPPRL
jgi:alkanesulfonate monooxygenase SsuD/methylene tetrahydromethanopterin reductase-like flavin-dependent oxidoreductase (luciferase family)